jgi:hypothetical protein
MLQAAAPEADDALATHDLFWIVHRVHHEFDGATLPPYRSVFKSRRADLAAALLAVQMVKRWAVRGCGFVAPGSPAGFQSLRFYPAPIQAGEQDCGGAPCRRTLKHQRIFPRYVPMPVHPRAGFVSPAARQSPSQQAAT